MCGTDGLLPGRPQSRLPVYRRLRRGIIAKIDGLPLPSHSRVLATTTFVYRASMSAKAPDHRRLIALAVLFEGGLAVLALGLGWLVDEPPLHSLHWSWNDAFASLAATLPMLMMLVVCLYWPIGPLARVRALLDDFVRPIFRGCSAMEVTAIACLAGLGEEMLFRGVLQVLASRWFGPWMSIGLVNVLFGLLHMVTPVYALTAGLIGLYLGWLMLWKQNLLVVIVPHALFDLAALLYVIYSTAAESNPPAQGQECS